MSKITCKKCGEINKFVEVWTKAIVFQTFYIRKDGSAEFDEQTEDTDVGNKFLYQCARCGAGIKDKKSLAIIRKSLRDQI